LDVLKMSTATKEKPGEGLLRAIRTRLYRDGFDGRENLRRKFAPEKSKNAFDKRTREWLELGELRSHDLAVIPGTRSYLTLGQEGVRAVGAPKRFAEPIPESELPYELGCLAYNSMREPYRKRLLPEELKKRFPFIDGKYYRWAWHVEFYEKKPVLTTIRTEHRGAINSVVEKLRHQIERFKENSQFAGFIESGRLQLVVIAATKEKANALETSFRELPEFITPRLKDFWEPGKPGTVRIKPVYYPPLIGLGG
jgi:hypothetical protein